MPKLNWKPAPTEGAYEAFPSPYVKLVAHPQHWSCWIGGNNSPYRSLTHGYQCMTYVIQSGDLVDNMARSQDWYYQWLTGQRELVS
jgi:hypothetical protein